MSEVKDVLINFDAFHRLRTHASLTARGKPALILTPPDAIDEALARCGYLRKAYRKGRGDVWVATTEGREALNPSRVASLRATHEAKKATR